MVALSSSTVPHWNDINLYNTSSGCNEVIVTVVWFLQDFSFGRLPVAEIIVKISALFDGKHKVSAFNDPSIRLR